MCATVVRFIRHLWTGKQTLVIMSSKSQPRQQPIQLWRNHANISRYCFKGNLGGPWFPTSFPNLGAGELLST